MDVKKVAWGLGIFGGLAVIVFAAGSLIDERIAEEFYIGANSYATMYEIIGKMPAFIMLAVACGLAARYFFRVLHSIVFTVLAYAAMFAVSAINFKDLTDLITDSTLYSLAGCAVLGAVLAFVIGEATKGVAEERLSEYFKWAVAVAVVVVATGVITFVAKEIFSRARYADVQGGVAQFAPWYDFVRVDGGDSMPSGHTAFTAVLFMMMPLCGINPRFAGRENTVTVVSVIATAVTAFSRITDGHHYLSDVAAAAFIAVAVQTVVIFVMYGKTLDKFGFNRFFVPKRAEVKA